jgi:hypothetical protein
VGSAFVLVAAATVLGVLVVSLVSTLRSRTAVAEFVAGVRELAVVPARLAAVTAVGAVCTELLVVALLVLPGTAVAGLVLASGLFAVYAVGLALAVRRGIDTSCHCFGAGGDAVAPRHVARAAALSAWSLAGALVGFAGDVHSVRLAGVPSTLVALVVAGCCIAAAVWVDELAWLFGRPTRSDQRSPTHL